MSCFQSVVVRRCAPAGRSCRCPAGMRHPAVPLVSARSAIRRQRRRHGDGHGLETDVAALFGRPAMGQWPLCRASRQSLLAVCRKTRCRGQPAWHFFLQRLAAATAPRTGDDHRAPMQEPARQSGGVSPDSARPILDGFIPRQSKPAGTRRLRFCGGVRRRGHAVCRQAGRAACPAGAQHPLALKAAWS
jgi:hypothetical protein